ncbi:MAG: hypothetical protein K2Y17_11255 [Qipengyuania sp.]|nr:hypothetical protein [Qipengyuania sp.]
MNKHTPPPAPSSPVAEEDSDDDTPWDPHDNPYVQVEKDRIATERAAEEAAARADAAARPPFALTAASSRTSAYDGDALDGEQEDRWSKRKMADFLRVLAAQQSVAAAARSVGMSRQSAYKLRNRLKGEPFDIAWEAAFQHGYDALHQAALERALHGVEVPVFHKGEQIGARRHFDERLTTFLLARRNTVGAQRLGRYGAAAEFWSERWERMLEQVETGPVVWLDEAGQPFRANDAKLSGDMLIRHALDEAEDRARFGGKR